MTASCRRWKGNEIIYVEWSLEGRGKGNEYYLTGASAVINEGDIVVFLLVSLEELTGGITNNFCPFWDESFFYDFFQENIGGRNEKNIRNFIKFIGINIL